MAHGGMGYAKEFDVERYLREVDDRPPAPVSRDDPELTSPSGAGPAEELLNALGRPATRSFIPD